MSRNIWIVSDTHFGHANILKFVDSKTGIPVRGDRFANVDEMNEHMIEKWNSVVKEGDIVYHLGDVVMGLNSQEWFKSNWPRLKGSKRLIVGNHDDIKFLSSGGFFKKVQMWRMMPEFGLLFSHVPIHESGLKYLKDRSGIYPDDCETLVNVHGHTHQHGSPEGPYLSTCVELRDYTPVHIEDLQKEAKSLLNK
jgi:calcineurin-like phosphoesterase family protein